MMFRFRGDDHIRALYRAAHEELTLDSCSGGTSCDYTAAFEDFFELALRERVRVRIDEIPLAPADEPHRIRVLQRFNEFLGIRDFRVVCVKHRDVLQPESLPRFENVVFLVNADGT